MENDEFAGETDEKELVLEFLKFSTSLLLYMIEDLQNLPIFRKSCQN